MPLNEVILFIRKGKCIPLADFAECVADMAELADALDLGSSVNRRAGSTPVIRIKKGNHNRLPFSFI